MPTTWRLIPNMLASGPQHMAIDAWLLNQLIKGQQRPTLRFYQWQPVALSLGYHQSRWPEHWCRLFYKGQPVKLVRRPTGGRAVLHQGDFTYAITLPMMGERRQDLYQRICDALIAAWERLSVSLSYGTGGKGYRHQASCFALATTADLVTPTGYKLIGNAQLRRDRYLLQQGTIRLWPNHELYAHVFGETIGTASPPEIVPACLSNDWLSQLSGLIVAEIERCLDVIFEPEPLTLHESQRAYDAYGEQVIIQ